MKRAMPTNQGSPPDFIAATPAALPRAMMAPTDTSIPRATMTNVIPTATMPMSADCSKTLLKFEGVRKFGVNKDTPAHSTRKIK